MLKTLVYTTLYPNAEAPSHGIFVENRLRHLLAGHAVEAEVVAPVPYFPWAAAPFGRYGRFARVPAREERHGITVHHPRYPLVPKLGMAVAPALLYLATRRFVADRLAVFPADLIDAHYFYPDGVAAAAIAGALAKPVTITARGTDLNLIPNYRLPRRQIQWAAGRADGLIAVCQALKDSLVALGVAEDRVRVLRNGVDLALFRPHARAAARAAHGVEGRRTLLSVGHLIARKGHELVIAALAELEDTDLLIAGEGPEREHLERLAAASGVADRVRFLGRLDQAALAPLYSAADILVLASSREGWPNVLLEAMACGTPVVATDVWGSGEVVGAPEAGRLVTERTSSAIADAVRDLFAHLPDRAETRAYAENFSWDETSAGQLALFREILERPGGGEPGRAEVAGTQARPRRGEA